MTFLTALSLLVGGIALGAMVIALLAHEVEMIGAARRERRRLGSGRRLPMARKVRRW